MLAIRNALIQHCFNCFTAAGSHARLCLYDSHMAHRLCFFTTVQLLKGFACACPSVQVHRLCLFIWQTNSLLTSRARQLLHLAFTCHFPARMWFSYLRPRAAGGLAAWPPPSSDESLQQPPWALPLLVLAQVGGPAERDTKRRCPVIPFRHRPAPAGVTSCWCGLPGCTHERQWLCLGRGYTTRGRRFTVPCVAQREGRIIRGC